MNLNNGMEMKECVSAKMAHNTWVRRFQKQELTFLKICVDKNKIVRSNDSLPGD
jgi:hypothetical protein